MSKRPPSSVSRSRMLNSPHPTWPAFDRSSSPAGFEPNPLIRHGDAQLIVGVERQIQRDAIRVGVLDRIEQELSDRLEQQRADVLPRRNRRADRRRPGRRTLYLSCVQFASHVSAAGSPECCSTGGNSSKFSERAAAIASSR